MDTQQQPRSIVDGLAIVVDVRAVRGASLRNRPRKTTITPGTAIRTTRGTPLRPPRTTNLLAQ